MSTGAPTKRPSDLALRTVVGLAMVAVAIAALWFGDIVFWILCSVLGLFMMAEWADLDGASSSQKRLAQFALSVPLAIMAPIAAGPDFFALGLIAAAAFFIVIAHRRPTLALGAIYVGLPILALLLIRNQEEGLVFTFWALALVWVCDIGAYFSGRAIGGPKLAPAISPNKTLAGLAGGVLLAGAFGAAMPEPASAARRSGRQLSSATTAIRALVRIAALASLSASQLAVSARTSNRSGSRSIRSRVEVPTDPVAPRMVTVFTMDRISAG